MKKIIYIASFALLCCSCAKKENYTITSMKGDYISVTEQADEKKDKELNEFINSYKIPMDKEMDKVVGHSALHMVTGYPESQLTNLTSDWMLAIDKKHTGGKQIDVAFMNVHGIRAPISEGVIKLGDVFAAFPFENTLEVVEIKGKYLKELFEACASTINIGVSKNVKLTVKDKKVVKGLLGGKAVEDDKIYTVLTLDYLAGGNDGMDAIKNAESSTPTGIRMRDFVLEHIQQAEAKHQKISAKLDGRITIL